MHIGTFCQFPLRLISYYDSNKSTGKETGKMYLCALLWVLFLKIKSRLLFHNNKILWNDQPKKSILNGVYLTELK